MSNYAHFPRILANGRGWPRCYGGPMTYIPPWCNLKWKKLLSWNCWCSPTQGHGEAWKNPMTYGIPSDSTQENNQGGMAFRLAMLRAHPHQAYLSSLDEAVRKPTLIINLTDNWAYAFVWLNKDAQHVPLSNKGHPSAIVDGVLCRTTCEHLHQLEVCRLLQYGDQVVYPKGLNGGLELVQTSLSGSLIQGHGYAWQTCPWTFIPTSGPLPGHIGRPYTQGPSSPQYLDTTFTLPSCHGTSL